MPELWLPGAEGPHEDFVERIHRQIERFAQRAGVERAVVDVELVDGSRFVLDSLSPEPGYGFVTIRPHREGDEDVPEELIVPIGSLRRIELARAEERRARFGFSVPESR
jgi:hypothetical protein